MKLSHRIALGATLATMLLTGATAAFAAESDMMLFKIITDKDEVIIGMTAGELDAAGGQDAGIVGKKLVADGQLTAWQYVVGRNDAGELIEAPTSKISVLAHDSLRVEPYQAEWPISLPMGE
jgi:uncharacterized membrane protein